MKSIMKTALAAIMLATAGTASAQYRFGGMLMDQDGMMSNDMYTLSQVNFGFGTARSMGMAGAFTSLGGDIASIGINPAGLGMYRHNDISITPMLSFQRSHNSASDWGDNAFTRAAMSNVGAVLNLYEGASSHVVSFSVGIAYNRVADLNYRYGFSSASGASNAPYRSIADAFSRMMGQSGLFPSKDGALNYGYGDSYFWGGILAYNAFLLDVMTDEQGDYWTTAGRIGVNAGVGHTASLESKGSIGEYDISFGMNVDNLLYIGATVGLQDVDWRRQLYYGEDYLYDGQTPVDGSGTPLQSPAQWMDYNQAVTVSGTGVNLKIGAILRPTAELRIGAALHTPTYYILNRKYQAYMASNFNDRGDTTPSLEDVAPNTWDFVSPTRLMFGASYTFGNVAVVSVDYERDWYNGMRVKNIPSGFNMQKQDYRSEFTNNFKGSNTLRVGAEVKPLPNVALRAGYGYAGSMLRNPKEWYYNTPLTYQTTCYSAGVGFAIGGFTIDLAYQYLDSKNTSYYLYYALDAASGMMDTASPLYSTDYTRQYAILTLGYKF
ncbi:MAG: long-chain fatty acid transporter [Alistipes sp.]|nr:long-chain fatty acid transporter [Alistipes sp.]